MKKFLVICFAIFTVTLTASANDEDFYKALQGCTSYSSNGQTKTEGSVAKYTSQILGWENNRCVYKERVSFSGIESCTTCKFSQRQIDELVKVMRAYSTVRQYSGEEPDISTLSSVQNNPVVKVWNKYLMDSSVCTIELSK